jgi:hypothetical protein
MKQFTALLNDPERRVHKAIKKVQHALEDRDLLQNLEAWLQCVRIAPANSTRLTNLIAVSCILSWRIFWLTMMNRAIPNASRTLAFTALEIHLRVRLAKDKERVVHKQNRFRVI